MRTIILLICLCTILAACATSDNNSADILINDGNGVVRSEKFNLMWQQSKSNFFSSSEDALKYVNNLRLGGYTDWRIPTKAESHNLFFSLDFGGSDALDLDMKMNGSIWVVMEDGKLQPGSWDAGETCCIVRTFLSDGQGRVRAVRP